jgi:hypothetical protein
LAGTTGLGDGSAPVRFVVVSIAWRSIDEHVE